MPRAAQECNNLFGSVGTDEVLSLGCSQNTNFSLIYLLTKSTTSHFNTEPNRLTGFGVSLGGGSFHSDDKEFYLPKINNINHVSMASKTIIDASRAFDQPIFSLRGCSITQNRKFKKGNLLSTQSYRPISMLSGFSNVYESLSHSNRRGFEQVRTTIIKLIRIPNW